MFKINKITKENRGMSYVELIVVLSIFSVLSSVVIFNYGGFQARVDIKNLASDIALKAVEAQKSSMSGKLPPLAQQSQITSTWKPSYGIFIDRVADDKSFIYFTDLNAEDGLFDGSSCPGVNECLDKIAITKGNSISSLDVFYQDSTNAPLNNLTVTFKRPDSSAIIKSNPALNPNVSFIQITIASPKGATAKIKLYPSGRIQVN